MHIKDGIPLSQYNVSAYEAVYVLEQWLRRLAYAAVAARVGPNVLGGLPDTLVPVLKQRLHMLPARTYLGADTTEDVLWLTTLEELRTILLEDPNWPIVKRLSRFSRDVLGMKIDEIREIRNVVGHNRFVSGKTARILDAAILSLEHGLETFRAELARPWTPRDQAHLAPDPLNNALYSTSTRFPPDVWVVTQRQGFYVASLIPRHLREPVEGELEAGEWLDVSTLLTSIHDIREQLVGVLVPVMGTSAEFVWPKRAPREVHNQVVESFARTVASSWGADRLTDQDDRALCDPLIWLV